MEFINQPPQNDLDSLIQEVVQIIESGTEHTHDGTPCGHSCSACGGCHLCN